MIEKKHLSTWILNELHKKGDPLAIGIDYSETEELIGELRKRLSLGENILDLSPKSLDTLESSLKTYYIDEIKDARQLSEMQVLSLIREIIAYFGRVVVENTDGKWINNGMLKGTIIKIEGPITVRRKRGTTMSSGTKIFLWNIATVHWDNIITGFESSETLYKEYLLAKKKLVIGL